MTGVATTILAIRNAVGLHARPAAQFVKTANRFGSTISLEKDGRRVDAKSIIGVLSLQASQGSRVKVRAEGEDADEAIAALETLVNANFGEPQ